MAGKFFAYFYHWIGALHTVHWLKSSYSTFYHLFPKTGKKEEKVQQIKEKIHPKGGKPALKC